MATIPGNSVLEMTFRYLQNQQQMMTVLHYDMVPQADVPNYAAKFEIWLNSLYTSLVPEFMSRMHPSVSLQRISLQPVWPTRYVRIDDIPVGITGTNIGTPLPQNVAVTLTKRTEIAARHGIGSVHFPGTIVENVASGSLTPGALGSFNVLGGFLEQNLDVDDLVTVLRPIIWSAAAPSRRNAVNRVTAQPTLRVMRRRTVGVGI